MTKRRMKTTLRRFRNLTLVGHVAHLRLDIRRPRSNNRTTRRMKRRVVVCLSEAIGTFGRQMIVKIRRAVNRHLVLGVNRLDDGLMTLKTLTTATSIWVPARWTPHSRRLRRIHLQVVQAVQGLPQHQMAAVMLMQKSPRLL